MNVQRLQIEQQMARIEVETQNASLEIDMKQRKMKVEQQNAKMSVERQDPQIEFDFEDFYDNIGLKSIRTLSKESAAKADAQASKETKEIVEDGKFVGALPSSGNKIGQLARSKMLEKYVPEIGTQVPNGAIKMRGIPGDITIDWSSQDLRIVWDKLQSPGIEVAQKASVTVKQVQEPRIEYSVVEEMVPSETGKTVDTEV